MGGLFSKPKSYGPSKDQLEQQKRADARAEEERNLARRERQSTLRTSMSSRSGRRLLMAPGREEEVANRLSG